MGWAGRRILPREVELILKGPVRILPGDEDAGRVSSQTGGLAQTRVQQY